MEDRQAAIMDKVHPDLLAPPHIVDRSFQLIAGEWLPNHDQQEQLISHFMECPYCRMVLIALISAEQQDKRLDSAPGSATDELLTRFVRIHHELEAHKYENMAAYAERIVAKGQEEADKNYPVLAEHIKRCSSCKSTLEGVLAFLNTPEEAS